MFDCVILLLCFYKYANFLEMSSFGGYQRGGSVEFTSRWDSTQRSGSMSRSMASFKKLLELSDKIVIGFLATNQTTITSKILTLFTPSFKRPKNLHRSLKFKKLYKCCDPLVAFPRQTQITRK